MEMEVDSSYPGTVRGTKIRSQAACGRKQAPVWGRAAGTPGLPFPQHTPQLCRLFSLARESRATNHPQKHTQLTSHPEPQSQCQLSSPRSNLHPQVPGKYSHKNLFISSLLCYCLSWDQVMEHGTWYFSMIQGSHACKAQTADSGLDGMRLYDTFRLRASGDFPTKLRNVPSCTQDSRVGGREERGGEKQSLKIICIFKFHYSCALRTGQAAGCCACHVADESSRSTSGC